MEDKHVFEVNLSLHSEDSGVQERIACVLPQVPGIGESIALVGVRRRYRVTDVQWNLQLDGTVTADVYTCEINERELGSGPLTHDSSGGPAQTLSATRRSAKANRDRTGSQPAIYTRASDVPAAAVLSAQKAADGSSCSQHAGGDSAGFGSTNKQAGAVRSSGTSAQNRLSAVHVEVAEVDLFSRPRLGYQVNGKPFPCYAIGVLAKALNREPVTIRLWERQGFIPKTKFCSVKTQGAGRARLYTREQIEGIVRIAHEEGIIDGSRNFRETDFTERVTLLFNELIDEYRSIL